MSRHLGIEILGSYTATLNTASSVVSPFASVVGNNTNMLAAAHRLNAHTYVRVARASATLTVGLSLLACVVFLAINPSRSGNGSDVGVAWIVIGGASVILGQAVFAVIQGCLYGDGRSIPAARVSVGVALAVALSSIVIVPWAGLRGAFALLVALSLMPSAIVASGVFLFREATEPESLAVWRETWDQFVVSSSSMLATAVENGVGWACTVYFVQQVFGMEGVGLLGIAGQWQTAMLLPTMSWGGANLKTLSDTVATGEAPAVFAAMSGLIKRNVLATAVLGAIVSLCSGYLASAYRLSDSGLAGLICFNAVVALTRAAGGVPELLMVCLRQQRLWLVFSLVASAVQATITVVWASHGLWVVVLGVIGASVTRGLLCLIVLPGLVRTGTRR
ncbi:MAG: hypothetical protein ABL971_10355 [Vicinamibacterales bacterium]